MPMLDLVLYPDDPLTRTSEPYEGFDGDLVRLAEDMLETMYTYEGVGLAGPQVGIAKRLFVMHEPDGKPMCLVNPEILESEGSETGEEGCLSLPKIYAMVPRAARIRVRAYDHHGAKREFESFGYQARIIQHEIDHLEGIIFPDRLDILSREATLQEWAEIREKLLNAKS